MLRLSAAKLSDRRHAVRILPFGGGPVGWGCGMMEEVQVSGELLQLIRQMMRENKRHMSLGRTHMDVDEMRFIVGGVLGSRGEVEFDAICSHLKK